MAIKKTMITMVDMLLLTSTMMVTTSGQGWTSGQLYKSLDGLEFAGSEFATHYNVAAFGKCALICDSTKNCKSATHNKVSRVCKLSSLLLHEPAVQVSQSSNSSYFVVEDDPEWKLAFRATQGIGISVYGTWINEGHHDDGPTSTGVPIGCYTVDGRLSCDRHFRSQILDNWHDIKQAKYVFYKDGVSKAYVTFDATGTTHRDEPFETGNKLKYSFPEMSSRQFALRSVQGSQYADCGRRFYLPSLLYFTPGNYFSHCESEKVWMMVREDKGENSWCCDHDRLTGSRPEFLYGKNNQRDFHSKLVSADVFAVLVKT